MVATLRRLSGSESGEPPRPSPFRRALTPATVRNRPCRADTHARRLKSLDSTARAPPGDRHPSGSSPQGKTHFEGAPRALEVPRRPLGRDLPQPLRSRQMPAARWLLIRLVRTKQLTDVYASSTSLSCFAIRALTTCLAWIASLKPGVEAAEATRCSVRADGGRAGPPSPSGGRNPTGSPLSDPRAGRVASPTPPDGCGTAVPVILADRHRPATSMQRPVGRPPELLAPL